MKIHAIVLAAALMTPAFLMSGTANAVTVNAAPPHTLSVVSGGIGEEGQAEINNIQNNYSLKVVFVGEGGVYLDAVNVTIDDGFKNRIVNTTTEGPMLLADLNPGRYMLTAEVEGHTVTQVLQIGKKGLRTYTLRFPVND